jgi:hypothetical protein
MDGFLQVRTEQPALLLFFSQLRRLRMAWATIAGKGGQSHHLSVSRSGLTWKNLVGGPRSVESGEHGPEAHFLGERQCPLLLVIVQPLDQWTRGAH